MKSLTTAGLLLIPSIAIAGPITTGSFISESIPDWASSAIPSDSLTLSSAPFDFEDPSGTWKLLAEQSDCGDNKIGYNNSGLLFDGSSSIGDSITIELPELIAFSYQIGDGELWLSDNNYLHFTLFQDDNAYYVGMIGECNSISPPISVESTISGSDEPFSGVYIPPTIIIKRNFAIIKILKPTITPTATSVPEPASLVLVGIGLLCLARKVKNDRWII